MNVANFEKLGAFLGDRIDNKPIKLKVKAPNGREMELEASSQAEFDYADQKAQAFLTDHGLNNLCRLGGALRNPKPSTCWVSCLHPTYKSRGYLILIPKGS